MQFISFIIVLSSIMALFSTVLASPLPVDAARDLVVREPTIVDIIARSPEVVDARDASPEPREAAPEPADVEARICRFDCT